ncbi:MAG: choice-of-anchor F family protein [Pseudomonas sp.]|nr:choice-of-anchor F family protein [Pseudomonas sp.]
MANTLGALLITGSAIAQEPTPTTYADVPVPRLTDWNDVNRLTVDGVAGATAKTYIYTDAASKQAAAAPGGNWDTNSPAQVYWELDDGSGRAPGIQAVTDDLDFPTNNCIMASGERESSDFPGTIIPKTCSDPESSSKRYFLEIVQADTPVDIVFDVGLKDIRYKGVKDPATDGGEALAEFREEFGIGRIYRVIQKVINNSDERWVAINVELGHGIGTDFQRLDFAQDGVAFELRQSVPREFFDGNTGAPDIAVWNPNRYATFSPKAFDDGARDRFDPGFFDAAAAGFFPPRDTEAGEKSAYINSGEAFRPDGAYGAITLNHFSMVDAQAAGSTVDPGVFGYMLSDSLAPIAISRYEDGNPEGESDAIEAWWDGSDWRYGLAGDAAGLNSFGIVPADQLTQWATQLLGIDPSVGDSPVRYASLLADDLATQNMDFFINITDGILDDAGVPKYDSITLRVTGISSTGLGAVTGNDEPAWVASPAPTLATYMAATGVPVALNDLSTMFENDPTSPYYNVGDEILNVEILANDLLDGQLLSALIGTTQLVTLVDAIGGVATLQPDNTVNFTPDVGFVGLASFTYTVSVDAVASNEATVAIRVNAYPDPDAPVAANDSAVTFEDTPVTIDVLANDSLPLGDPIVAILDAPLTGSATIEDNKVVYTPATGFVGLDRFTYTVTANGKTSNAALITVRIDEPVVEPPVSSSGGGGGGGCSYNPGAPFDPTLILLFLLALGGIAARRRVSRQSL